MHAIVTHKYVGSDNTHTMWATLKQEMAYRYEFIEVEKSEY